MNVTLSFCYTLLGINAEGSLTGRDTARYGMRENTVYIVLIKVHLSTH